ncbi:hypothetical protein AVEN_219591-1, partial [Araneus ventricosus]
MSVSSTFEYSSCLGNRFANADFQRNCCSRNLPFNALYRMTKAFKNPAMLCDSDSSLCPLHPLQVCCTDEEFVLKEKLSGEHIHKGLDGKLKMYCLNFDLNEDKGMGIVINENIQKLPKRTLLPEVSYPSPSVVPLVVPFSEKVCQNPDITGGKGSSLGKLTELSQDFKNVVPNGVVVTTAAYEVFVTDEILKEIKKLEKVL